MIWSTRTQAFQILRDSLHILRHALNNFWRPYGRQSIATSLVQLKKHIDSQIKEWVFFYLMILNIYYWEKLTFSKLVGKVNFSERVVLICFARQTKGFYQSSLGNGVGFREIMNGSPNILAEIKILKNWGTVL